MCTSDLHGTSCIPTPIPCPHSHTPWNASTIACCMLAPSRCVPSHAACWPHHRDPPIISGPSTQLLGMNLWAINTPLISAGHDSLVCKHTSVLASVGGCHGMALLLRPGFSGGLSGGLILASVGGWLDGLYPSDLCMLRRPAVHVGQGPAAELSLGSWEYALSLA